MILLFTLLVKSLLVFALAGAALLGLRRASAAARHLVCLLTLVSLLALPLFSLTLPGWRLPVLSQAPMAQPTLPEPTPAQVPTLPKGEGTEFKASPLPAPLRPPLWGGPGRSEERTKQGGGFLALYLIGILLAGLRPLLGLWGIQRLGRLCTDADDPPTLTAAADCAALLRLRRPRLCRADVSVPMTWGGRRPVVLLPTASTDWPEDRLRSVLLHEMAHIKRRDWSCHRFADLVCALYWFHPFVWLTARRLRSESELACDDLVLSSGIAAPDYARHLLDVAQALRPASPPPHSAIAMAHTSRIEERLTMILDKTRSRRILTRRALLTALALGAAALVPLAMFRPVAKAQTVFQAVQTSAPNGPGQGAAMNSSSASWRQVLPNGVTVELVGVADFWTLKTRWWKPSGSPLALPPYDHIDSERMSHWSSGRQFALRVTPPFGTADKIDTDVHVEGADGGTSAETPSLHGHLLPRLLAVSMQTDTLPRRGVIHVRVAAGPWETWVTDDGFRDNIGPMSSSGYFHGANGNILFSLPSEIGGNAAITVTNSFSNAESRVVAVDREGKFFQDSSGIITGIGQVQQTTCVFADLPLKRVKEFRFQARPYQAAEFKNVALEPVQAELAVATVPAPVPGVTPWNRVINYEDWKIARTDRLPERIQPSVSGTRPDPPVSGNLVYGPGKAVNFSIKPWKPGKSSFLTVKFDYTPKVADKVHPDIIYLLTKQGAVAGILTYYSI